MFYSLVCFLFVVFYTTLFRCKVHGRENIPAGGFILCSNHISWFDPPLVGCTLWKRKVYFMAKEELFSNRLFSLVLRKLNAFPVKRDRADRRAIQYALALLKEDGIVGMFPEGTRSKTGSMQELLDGAALLALKSNVPVLPVAVKGPYRLFRPVRVYIGNPLYFNNYKKGKKYTREDLKEISKNIREGINSLLEES